MITPFCYRVSFAVLRENDSAATYDLYQTMFEAKKNR